jgi:hypothetical protein
MYVQLQGYNPNEKEESHQSRLHKNKVNLSLTHGLALRATAFSSLTKNLLQSKKEREALSKMISLR